MFLKEDMSSRTADFPSAWKGRKAQCAPEAGGMPLLSPVYEVVSQHSPRSEAAQGWSLFLGWNAFAPKEDSQPWSEPLPCVSASR